MLLNFARSSYNLGDSFRVLENLLLDLEDQHADRPLHWQTLRKIERDQYVELAERTANLLGLESVMRQIVAVKRRLIQSGEKLSASDVKQMIWQLDDRIQEELALRYFLFVQPSKVQTYSYPANDWKDTPTHFPSALFDIEEASRCLALGRGTAAVFHCMRVLQLGLASMAGAVNSTISNPADQNWHRIIENIEARLKEVQPGQPKAPDMTGEDRRFFSQAALQFMYFKDAFRNYVTHTPVAYDAQGAESILNHVRDFMGHLATRLVE